MEDQRQKLKRRATTGVLLLGVKRLGNQLIVSTTSIFLARLLFPSDFGTFAIVTFTITFFTVFSDLGLGPSLVQKKEEISKEDLQTALTMQLLLSIAVVTVVFLAAPMISGFYNISEKGILLFRIYSFYLLFTPLKTTSGAIMERNLEYKKLIIIETLELLVSSSLSVLLAFLGFGVFSLAYGLVIGHFVGALLYFSFSRWPIRFVIFGENLRSLAKFGLPFQSNAVLGLFYGPLILLYLGKAVGPANLGYFQWAAGFAVFSTFASDIMNRILFPLGARSQMDKQFFRNIIERSLVIVSATSLPLMFLMMAAAPSIIHFVYTDKWLPALPAVYLSLAQMGIIAYTGIFSSLLLSRGRADITRNMGVVWAVLTWVLSPPLIYFFNFVGMSLAALLVSASGIYLFFRLRSEVDFSFFGNFVPYFFAAAISGISVFLATSILPNTLPALVFTLGSGLAFYGVLIWFLRGKAIFTNFKYLLLVLRRG